MPRPGGRGGRSPARSPVRRSAWPTTWAARRAEPPATSPEAPAVIDWRCGPVREPSAGGDGGVVMASKDNLHRETLRAALRIIQTAETLEQARIQLARMLNVFDKLEAQGHQGRCGGGRGRGAADDHPGAEGVGGRRAAGPAAGAGVRCRKRGPRRHQSVRAGRVGNSPGGFR